MPKAKKRDPSRPKRALTGFMFYSKERRPQVKEENPDIKFGDIGKKLGEEWKAMSETQRRPYEAQAAEDKERYKDAMTDYVPDPQFAKRGKRRDPNKPKRAMSAYLYFCKAHRDAVKAEYPEKTMIEVQKVLGERWKLSSESDRAPFIKQADADRERYDSEMLKLAKKTAVDDDDVAEDEDDDIGNQGDGY